jgi:hypothetical protein
MSELDYFRSITEELDALKNRVRHFIRNKHWLTDGEHKESVLRAVLRRHLPLTTGVGRGFVITNKGPSPQIDILLYDQTKPLLYHDGDFVIITPDACQGMIEVKTKLTPTKLGQAIQKLVKCRVFVSRTALAVPFVGLFAYDHNGLNHKPLLKYLKAASQRRGGCLLNCVSLGPNLFARYWECAPENRIMPVHIYRAYKLRNIAPTYFVHNAIEALCPQSVGDNNRLWYPTIGKEASILGDTSINEETG